MILSGPWPWYPARSSVARLNSLPLLHSKEEFCDILDFAMSIRGKREKEKERLRASSKVDDGSVWI